MLRASLINGNWLNLDADLSKHIETLTDPGVIEGFLVENNNTLKPGKAWVKAVRSNGETIFVYVELKSDFSFSLTSGKLWIELSQEAIDNWLLNAEDGTGIASIKTWPSVPSQNFLLLATATGGVVRLDRTIIPKVGQLVWRIAQVERKVTETTTELNKLSGGSYAFNKEYYSLDTLKKGEDFGFVPELSDEDYFGMVAVGSAATNKVHKIKGFLSGENFNSIDLFLSKILTPSHNLIISIRDYKTNALINNNARVEIQPAKIKNIKEKVTVTFPGMITNNQKWRAVVIQVETAIDNPNNYYVLYANYKFNNLAEEVNDISTVLFKNTKAEDKIESTASTVWPDFMTITGDGRNYQWFTLKKPIEWDFEIEREGSIQGSSSWWHFFWLTGNANRTWPIAIFQYSRDKRWTGILNHSGNNNIWQYHDWQFHVWKIKREGNKAYFYVDWTLKGQLEVNTIPVYFAGQTYDNWSLMKLKYIKISKLIKKSYIHYYSIGLISDIVLKATPQIDSRYLYPTTNISTMEWWVFTMYGFVDTWIKWVFWIWEDWKLSQSPKIVLWEDDFFYGEQEPGLSPWPYIVAFGWTKNWNSTETKQFICPKKSFCKMSFNLNTSNYWGDSRCHIKLKKNWKELQALSKNWDWTSEIYFIIPKGLIDVELYTRNTSGYDPYMYYNIYIQSDLSS